MGIDPQIEDCGSLLRGLSDAARAKGQPLRRSA
jgi:hypothetical protein